MTTTLYVAGPMTGQPDHGWPAFIDATARLRAAGYRVISPHEFGQEGVEDDRAMLLRIDLSVMLTGMLADGSIFDGAHAEPWRGGADALALLDGWLRSKGAVLERGVANALDMPCHPLGHWLSEAIGEGAHPGEIEAAGSAAVRAWRAQRVETGTSDGTASLPG